MSKAAADQTTDHSRWRLRNDRGTQTWHYLRTDKEVEEWPQTIADKYFLGQPLVGASLFPLFRPALAAC